MKNCFHRTPDVLVALARRGGVLSLAVLAWFAAVYPPAAAAGGKSEFRLDPMGAAGVFDATVAVGPVAPPAEATITRIVSAGAEIIISVWVPAGKQRVTLECRPRLGPGAWVPESRQILDGRPGEVEFRLSNRRELELMRVRAESLNELPLPAGFYTGKSQFAGWVATNAPTSVVALPGTSSGMDVSGRFMFDSISASQFNVGAATGATGIRTVAESDIWRIDNQTLYFFNQGRGLQVIDLSNPDAPRLRGEWPVAAYGEQMYLLPAKGADDARYVALLLASGCSDGGSVMVVRVAADGQLNLVNQLPFAGQLRESRLVGDALYLAAYWWHGITRSDTNSLGQVTTGVFQWQSDTVVTSYRLSDPAAHDLVPDVLTLPANPDAIQATDQFLFVATTRPSVYDPTFSTTIPGANAVEIIDISDVSGRMIHRGSVATRGGVANKFKISQDGAVLRVASFRNSVGQLVAVTNWFSRVTGSLMAVSGGTAGLPAPANSENYRPEVRLDVTVLPAQAWMETYSLNDPAAPLKLGELLIKENEQLYATRFAGDRAYVVTFRRVDPLMLIDLSDPVHPQVRGELEVPGFSTYLSPLGDTRLLAMGLENGQPIVSLFDVADLTHPRLLSKVDLKAQNGWGYSEANNDEKAFQYSAEAGLILFPWQGWNNGQSFQTIQLVDLKEDVLRRRGVIDHAVTARRATVLGDRVISIAAAELLSVTIQDRDQPTISARLPLQYQVDRVWVLNNRLVHLATESISNGLSSRPWISLAASTAPERSTGTLSLPPGLSTLGLELKGDRLHVLQQAPMTYRTEDQGFTNVVTGWVERSEPRRETNVSLTRLPPEYRVTLTTNVVVESFAQTPIKPILATNESVVTIQYPLFPTLVPYLTNRICPPDLTECVTNVFSKVVWVELPPLVRTNRTYVYGPEIPQPDLLVTNEVVHRAVDEIPGRLITNSITIVTNWYALPPVLQTNWYVGTYSVSVQVPGYLLASVVDCSGETPRILGQTRSDEGLFFNGGSLTAVWPAPDQLVWTDTDTAAGGMYYGPMMARTGFVTPGVGLVAVPIIDDWNWRGFGWGASVQAHFLPVLLVDPAQPSIGKSVTVGQNQEWSAVHPAFALEGRIYFSHETRKQLPETTVTNDVVVKPGTIAQPAIGSLVFTPWLNYARWETHHHLDVLDLTDPVEVQVRPTRPLPGPLVGVSHQGALLYARGGGDATGTWVDQMHALSYDGLEVNLVDSLPLNSAPAVVRPNGVMVFAPMGTTNSPATIESWALGTDAHWHQYARQVLAQGPASGLHAFAEGLVIAELPGAGFSFWASEGPDALTSLGVGNGQCGLLPDWRNSDATPASGLWLARGAYGLWNIRPGTGSLQP